VEEESIAKPSFRMPKTLHKQLKQFALDNDKSLNDIALEAFREYLDRHQGKKR
jgi:predicted HicB family RNase H-like nuclease